MYTGSLAAASNQADWTVDIRVIDSDEDEIVDISGCSIELQVRDQQSSTTMLTASVDNGRIAFPEDGVFEWSFTAENMGCLCAGTYDVGIIASQNGITIQLVAGTVQIVDGIVV